MNLYIKYSLLFLFCCRIIAVTGQSFIQDIHRDHFTRFISFDELVGTNLSQVTDIAQDTAGFIWLASPKGLFRYDGTRLQSYISDTLEGSLPSTMVHCLHTSENGKLWIGTHAGLCFYLRGKDRFETVFGSENGFPVSDSLYVRAILAEGDSILWFETLQGYLHKMDQKTFRLLASFKHQPTLQPYYPYHTIYRDQRGKLWVGGRGISASFLDEQGSRIVVLPSGPPELGRKREPDVSVYMEDSSGHFLVGGLDGLYLFDPQEYLFEKVYRVSTWSAVIDQEGMTWLGTGNGACRIDPESRRLTLFLNHEDDPKSISGNNVKKVFGDRFGNIWLLTGRGISVFQPPARGLEYLFHIPGIDDSPASSVITDLAHSGNGGIWMGTSGHGVDLYDLFTGKFEHFNPATLPSMISGKVRCLLPMKDGSVFTGLWAGMGFGRIYPRINAFSHYRYDLNTLKQDWYNDLAHAPGNEIYLGFWGADGLTLFDTEKGEFTRSLKDRFADPYQSRLITCLHNDAGNRLWVGTTHTGIHSYDPVTDTGICYFERINPAGGFSEAQVFDIAEDHAGRIWASGNTVYLFDEAHTTFIPYINIDPAREVSIYEIVPAGDSLLFLLTESGLFLFNIPDSTLSDLSNLVNLRFSEEAGCGLEVHPGQIMIGSENGLAMIEPAVLSAGKKMPEVFFSMLDFYKSGKIHNPRYDTILRLRYDENFFTVYIGTTETGHAGIYRYYFQLENFDRDWQELSPAEMMARFTNVPPGNYTFRVKLEDGKGNPVIQRASFHLLISPPFWETWWFILLIVLALATGIYLFARWRMKNIRLALQNLEIRQKLLRLQMNPHFIFNSLSAIQSFIYAQQTHLAGDYLSEFARMIRLILENSRHEEISLEKEITFIELYLSLQQLRFEQKFDYILETDETLDAENILVPPMLSQPFLENAIEHGIRHSPNPGKLKITFRLQDKGLIFVLEDNGIGLSASKLINAEKKGKHQSLAIDICRQRLEQIKRQSGIHIALTLEEIIDESGLVAGTRVSYLIPLKRRV